MAFAGSDPYGIFSGAFNSASNGIQWGAAAEAGERQSDGKWWWELRLLAV